MLHRSESNRKCLLYRGNLRVKVRMEKESAGPWRVGHRAGNESPPQEYRGGKLLC